MAILIHLLFVIDYHKKHFMYNMKGTDYNAWNTTVHVQSKAAINI